MHTTKLLIFLFFASSVYAMQKNNNTTTKEDPAKVPPLHTEFTPEDLALLQAASRPLRAQETHIVYQQKPDGTVIEHCIITEKK